METLPGNLAPVTAASKRIGRLLLTIGENRLQLLLVEIQEEREHLLRAVMLTLVVAVFVLLAGIAFTGAIVFIFWQHSPIIVLLALTAVYSLLAALLYKQLIRLRHDWQTLPATLEQLRKDRECLERTLS